jgi:4-hydroxy-tetrahydrodipicolinate reductase
MGRVIASLAEDTPDVKVVAGVDPNGEDNRGFPVYTDIFAVKEEADVLVDFSHHSAVFSVLRMAKTNCLPVVIATTGHTPEEKALIEAAASDIPVFSSANMSLGINLLMLLCKQAASVLEGEFDIEIIEKHHNKKLDAPSGTAYLLADAINHRLKTPCAYMYDRHAQKEARKNNEIGIHAVRGGTIVGEHEVLFAGKDEVISLSHSAASRRVFAEGAIKAAFYIKDRKPGLYSMNDLLKMKLDV